jgi:hypothetical protein
MKNNWRKTIDTINAERFTIPEGWDTRDQVAISLECAPEKVLDLLKPGIASGEIERGEFSVWNPKRRQTEKIVCFRVVQQQESKKQQNAPDAPATQPTVEQRIIRALKAYPGLSDSAVARKLNKVSTQQVAAVRKKVG